MHRRAFTMIEMLTTVAVLVIVLGLMVSLARYVRDQSANQLTSKVLFQLDAAVQRYADHNGGRVPQVEPFLTDSDHLPDEGTLHRIARKNNEDFVRALAVYFAPSTRSHPLGTAGSAGAGTVAGGGGTTRPSEGTGEFGDLPISIYDNVTLRDAWGDPIVFMPHEHPAIGMASRNHPSFFFSAGPDQRYLTRDDNLYSYEAAR